LKKSGDFDNIDPKIREWLQSPKVTSSSKEFEKQTEAFLKS
jgi:hypothetical protein